jgi:hypothetical protein
MIGKARVYVSFEIEFLLQDGIDVERELINYISECLVLEDSDSIKQRGTSIDVDKIEFDEE